MTLSQGIEPDRVQVNKLPLNTMEQYEAAGIATVFELPTGHAMVAGTEPCGRGEDGV